MLRMEAEQGIERIVATPHFYPQHDSPELFLNRLLGSDCHNLDSRKPNLEGALNVIKKRLGEDAISRVNSYARDLLSGD